jgi:hypothetical protein
MVVRDSPCRPRTRGVADWARFIRRREVSRLFMKV